MKFVCVCGHVMSTSGFIPNPDEWSLFADETVHGWHGSVPVDELVARSVLMYECPMSGHLWVYWDGMTAGASLYSPSQHPSGGVGRDRPHGPRSTVAGELGAIGLTRVAYPTTGGPTVLSSALEPPATEHEIADAWGDTALPPALVELWSTCRAAQLFVDENKWWGLELLSPAAARAVTDRTSRDLGGLDRLGFGELLIFGQFINDEDDGIALSVTTGHVVYLAPILLEEWEVIASSMADFLRGYRTSGGTKYWDPRVRRSLVADLAPPERDRD